MLEVSLQCLHMLPLALITLVAAGMVSSHKILARFSENAVLAVLLVLASVGIVVGSFIHDAGIAHVDFFDPCYGYALTIMGVAVKLAKARRATVKS